MSMAAFAQPVGIGGDKDVVAQEIIACAKGKLSEYLRSKELEKSETRHVGKISSFKEIKPGYQVTAQNITAEKISPRMLVWVDVKQSDKSSKSIPVWFAVKAYKNVLAARDNMGLRKDIRSADFITKVVNIAPLAANPAAVDTDFNQVQLCKPLLNDHVLTTSHIEFKPAVRSKNKVKVILENKGIKLETFGVAQRDASIGETIPVSPENNLEETFLAKVIEQGIVLVSGR